MGNIEGIGAPNEKFPFEDFKKWLSSQGDIVISQENLKVFLLKYLEERDGYKEKYQSLYEQISKDIAFLKVKQKSKTKEEGDSKWDEFFSFLDTLANLAEARELIKEITVGDLESSLLGALKEYVKGFDPREWASDIGDIFDAFRSGSWGLAKEFIEDFIFERIAKRFPAVAVGSIFYDVADRLLKIARQKKAKRDLEGAASRKIENFRNILKENITHIKGDTTGGGHFPGWRNANVTYENESNPDKRTGVFSANVYVDGVHVGRKTIFPAGWGEKEYGEIKELIITTKMDEVIRKITGPNQEISLKYQGINILVGMKKSGENYTVNTLYPQ